MQFVLIIFIMIILLLLLTWFKVNNNNYKFLKVKIDESETCIDSILKSKFELLNKAIGIIKGNIDKNSDEKAILEDIVKLRSRKLSNDELDKKLVGSEEEFNLIREEHPELYKSKNFVNMCFELNEIKINLSATKEYYNDTIVKYNKLVRSFPSNVIASIFRYKEKSFYENIDVK